MKLFTPVIAALLICSAASLAYADSQEMRDDETLAKSKVMESGNIHYTSGGIAESGMRAMDAEEHNFNLKLLFASKAGAYLANVKVELTDSNGKTILETMSKGPVMLIKLPQGHYKVTATDPSGNTAKRNVEVASDHLASYVLRYPTKDND